MTRMKWDIPYREYRFIMYACLFLGLWLFLFEFITRPYHSVINMMEYGVSMNTGNYWLIPMGVFLIMVYLQFILYAKEERKRGKIKMIKC